MCQMIGGAEALGVEEPFGVICAAQLGVYRLLEGYLKSHYPLRLTCIWFGESRIVYASVAQKDIILRHRTSSEYKGVCRAKFRDFVEIWRASPCQEAATITRQAH